MGSKLQSLQLLQNLVIPVRGAPNPKAKTFGVRDFQTCFGMPKAGNQNSLSPQGPKALDLLDQTPKPQSADLCSLPKRLEDTRCLGCTHDFRCQLFLEVWICWYGSATDLGFGHAGSSVEALCLIREAGARGGRLPTAYEGFWLRVRRGVRACFDLGGARKASAEDLWEGQGPSDCMSKISSSTRTRKTRMPQKSFPLLQIQTRTGNTTA